MSKYKVIVADDTKGVLDYVVNVLSKSNKFEVVDTAENGSELVEKVEKQIPELVITDVEMPNLTGIEAVRKLKDIQGIKYVIITGNKTAELMKNAYELDIKEIIAKPITNDDMFIDILVDVMESKECENQNEEKLEKENIEEKEIKTKSGILSRLFGRK